MNVSQFRNIDRSLQKLVSPVLYRRTRRILTHAMEIAVHTRGANIDLLVAAAMLHGLAGDLDADGLGRIVAFMTEIGFAQDFAEDTARCISEIDAVGISSTESMILSDAIGMERLSMLGMAEACYDGAEPDLLEEQMADIRALAFRTEYAAASAREAKKTALLYLENIRRDLQALSKRDSALLMSVLQDEAFQDRLLLVRSGGGFYMEGYTLGRSSVIYAEGQYHMFVTRCRIGVDAAIGSEIVRAVSDTPEGPFSFCSVVIGQRPRGFWDAQSASAPCVVSVPGGYLMLYAGLPTPDLQKSSIGYALAKTPGGTWIRSSEPFQIEDAAGKPLVATAPSALPYQQGEGLQIAFECCTDHRIYTAACQNLLTFSSLKKRQSVVLRGRETQCVGSGPFFCRSWHGGYDIYCNAAEEQVGVRWHAAHLTKSWRKIETVYDLSFMQNDMTLVSLHDRRYPFLLVDRRHRPTYLYTTVLCRESSSVVCQPLEHASGFTDDDFSVKYDG